MDAAAGEGHRLLGVAVKVLVSADDVSCEDELAVNFGREETSGADPSLADSREGREQIDSDMALGRLYSSRLLISSSLAFSARPRMSESGNGVAWDSTGVMSPLE